MLAIVEVCQDHAFHFIGSHFSRRQCKHSFYQPCKFQHSSSRKLKLLLRNKLPLY